MTVMMLPFLPACGMGLVRTTGCQVLRVLPVPCRACLAFGIMLKRACPSTFQREQMHDQGHKCRIFALQLNTSTPPHSSTQYVLY
jgi:hypothetical protein